MARSVRHVSRPTQETIQQTHCSAQTTPRAVCMDDPTTCVRPSLSRFQNALTLPIKSSRHLAVDRDSVRATSAILHILLLHYPSLARVKYKIHSHALTAPRQSSPSAGRRRETQKIYTLTSLTLSLNCIRRTPKNIHSHALMIVTRLESLSIKDIHAYFF